ncbi:DUF3060 domain-containing protein [Mycobacterium sp. 852002-51057_SCH5723018]|uniref:DUF3060 domain-containing protein n=1 Tax=Mycobacterium sp. 852002-51057_SCH5723018 TaxID=1834094 RepID=UPI000B257074|nr:DUF3060 domain-containing protein [Mycobacterium sp. 852002-51057_SCH5723018]
MKDDDPEKRIRELEQELADVTRNPQSPRPYTESAPYTSGPTYTGGATYQGGSPYGFGAPPPRRKTFPWTLALILVVFVLPTIVSLVAFFARSTSGGSTPRFNTPRTTTSSGPMAVPQGGELRVGGSGDTKTIACNDGALTLYGTGTKYSVTGHCASLIVGGYNNNVTVDSADTVESTGYGNTVTDHACNNGNLMLSSYGITFNVTGHCATVAISSYQNKVTVDSVDNVVVSGYENDVTYHSGKPKVTDSGYSNNIQQG